MTQNLCRSVGVWLLLAATQATGLPTDDWNTDQERILIQKGEFLCLWGRAFPGPPLSAFPNQPTDDIGVDVDNFYHCGRNLYVAVPEEQKRQLPAPHLIAEADIKTFFDAWGEVDSQSAQDAQSLFEQEFAEILSGLISGAEWEGKNPSPPRNVFFIQGESWEKFNNRKEQMEATLRRWEQARQFHTEKQIFTSKWRRRIEEKHAQQIFLARREEEEAKKKKADEDSRRRKEAAEKAAIEKRRMFLQGLSSESIDTVCMEYRAHKTKQAIDILRSRSVFTDEEISLIKEQQIRIGMSERALLCSWGNPRKVNRSVGSWGEHKQFVYRSSYVYTQNGRVTSYQDSQ